ncbi:regulatory LuxR family protein [Kribbella orskensis]|uniref:Regulatory LuxR family protein n=1 Tax=Kribbella orskensis TaxID=2512216 RepID=A0ABY2BF76_9ACTN|nr:MULTISPECIES: AAA family ATPase [Kribbella]TCN35005.1 regulatory LuxR family protein [Kribbella sp. VKM Ac-2500]TCO16372.1 regulatory LuxR family protein [Kribbella orskensis]
MNPLRGRSAELGRLLDALRAAEHGEASLTVVTGEPGIGKSALLRAASEQAERHGILLATAAAHQTDNISPLSSLAPALRAGPNPLISTDHFLELAALNGQPLWLAERLADLIGRRLDGEAALIVLDDAQWSDPLTGFVLRIVIARLASAKVMWLLATRPVPGGVTDQLIDAVQDQVPVHALQLAPLSTEAVLELAADRLDGPLDPALSVRLGGVQGVPFLAEQLVAGLYLSDLPDGLVEGVRRRTASTTDLCQALLRTAAVFGSEFRLEDVAELMGEPIARLSPPLDEAIRAGLLADGGSTLTFRHELLRSAVLADVPPSAQRALHRAIADQLLASGRGPAAAAPHILAVAAPGDATAISTLRQAARELLATMSITAVSVIQQAFELTPVDSPLRGDVGEDVVTMLLVARRFDDAQAFAEDLLGGTALYRCPVTPDLRASILLRLAPEQWATGRLDPKDLNVEGATSHLAERLAAYRVLAGVQEPFETEDPVANGVQLLAAGERARAEGRYGDASDLYAKARAATLDEVGSHPAIWIELAELFCLARTDRLEEARTRLQGLLSVGDSWVAPQLSVLRAQLELAAGNLPAAAEAATTGLRWMAEIHDHSSEPIARQVLALVALQKGHLSEAREQAAGDEQIRALLAIADGDPAAATRLLDTPRDFPERHEQLIHAATATKDPRIAQNAAALLADQAAATPSTHFRAAAQLVAAHNDADRPRLSQAVELLREAPRPLLLAKAEELYGLAELEDGDRATAVAALEHALDSFTELGATAQASRVQAVLQAAGVRRRRWAAVQARPETGWEALTPMERRVALLVAEGHTNRSAAEELVVSASTVGTHLRAAFGKLGVNSRVQLTRLVLERFASPPNA